MAAAAAVPLAAAAAATTTAARGAAARTATSGAAMMAASATAGAAVAGAAVAAAAAGASSGGNGGTTVDGRGGMGSTPPPLPHARPQAQRGERPRPLLCGRCCCERGAPVVAATASPDSFHVVRGSGVVTVVVVAESPLLLLAAVSPQCPDGAAHRRRCGHVRDRHANGNATHQARPVPGAGAEEERLGAEYERVRPAAIPRAGFCPDRRCDPAIALRLPHGEDNNPRHRHTPR